LASLKSLNRNDVVEVGEIIYFAQICSWEGPFINLLILLDSYYESPFSLNFFNF